jgi:hypothetical protein
MTNDQTTLSIWEPNRPLDISATASPGEIAAQAKALSERDISSIALAFQNGSFEMVSTFVWTRAITGLKKQIASLGMEFVGEMLGRPDINENSDPKTSIGELDAISLAEDLGMITTTEALRLKHALELVSHFADPENAVQDQMNPEEAVGILRACVVSILGNPHIKPPIQFAELRMALENESISSEDARVSQVAESPYFIQRTTLSVLLSLLKTAKGAQLEHAVGNTNVFLPRIWESLRKPERWQVGQTFAEVHSAGKHSAAVGLKNALTIVKGFDFVPETLRSDTFSAAAHKVMEAHFSFNNYYKEATPISELASLGTTIPRPAFPICMTAVLCVYLGNSYGVATAAQKYAKSIFTALRKEQWEYYLNECLRADKTILDKLESQRPADRWIALCVEFSLMSLKIAQGDILELLTANSFTAIQQARRKVRQRR